MNNRPKYSERDYLCKYDLSLKFFKELELDIIDIYPLRKVFMLNTTEGNKILKKVNYDAERIEFISECLNFVKADYPNIITYKRFKNGLYYKKWKDELYVIMDILEGREASFSNPVEIDLCGENVALLHKASDGLREYLNNKYGKDFLDSSLKEKIKKAYDNLVEIKDRVSGYKYKNEFDKIFMDNIDKYLGDILSVQEKLEKSKYEDLRSDGKTIALCHNDLVYHNFLTYKQSISIIDFDYMSIDLRCMDIADFILKCVKNSIFDMDKMINAFNGYEKVSVISEEEKEIIYIILLFPRDFYSIVKDYYYKQKSWEYDVFLNRLKSKMAGEEYRYDFLKAYKDKFNLKDE